MCHVIKEEGVTCD